MPIYEYNCADCETEFELFIRGSENPSCPQCGSKKLGKKWSTFSSNSSSANNRLRKPISSNNSGKCCQGTCNCHSKK